MSRKKRTRSQAEPVTAAPPPARERAGFSHRWILGLILVATFLTFANTLFNQFAYDDTTQILGNQEIRSFANLPIALTKEVWFWRVAQDKDPNKDAGPTTPYYRPMFTIYLMAGWFLFGDHPLGWHLINVLMHMLAVTFVFLILRRVTSDDKVTGIATLLFALHPLRVESVAWISGITDLFMALFLLPSFYFYMRYRDTGHKNYLGGSVLLFLFAAFSKEPAVALPIFIGAYELFIINQDRPLRERLRPALLFPVLFLMMALIYFVMRYHALGFVLNDRSFTPHTPKQVVLTIPIVICKYIGLLLWPMNLSIFHDTPMVDSPLSWRFFVPLLVVAALVYGAWRVRGSRAARFAVLWFAINLLPVLNLGAFGADFLVQERYVYIPSVGFSLLLAMALARVPLERWFAIGRRATAQVALVAIIAVLLTAKTVAQNSVWKDDMTLWSHGAEVADDQPMAHFILGHKFINEQKMDKAIEELEKFNELREDNVVVLHNLAAAHLLRYEYEYTFDRAHADRAHIDRAIALCNRGLNLQPSPALTANMYDLLGKAYSYETPLKNLDRSIYFFQNAVRMDPGNAVINYHLGTAYFKQQKYDPALDYLSIAMQLTSEIPDIYKIMAASYQNKGQLEEAIKYYDLYLKRIPNAVDAAAISQQVKDLRAQLPPKG
jgi:tetratricopeptide (TPR) repeat protein